MSYDFSLILGSFHVNWPKFGPFKFHVISAGHKVVVQIVKKKWKGVFFNFDDS